MVEQKRTGAQPRTEAEVTVAQTGKTPVLDLGLWRSERPQRMKAKSDALDANIRRLERESCAAGMPIFVGRGGYTIDLQGCTDKQAVEIFMLVGEINERGIGKRLNIQYSRHEPYKGTDLTGSITIFSLARDGTAYIEPPFRTEPPFGTTDERGIEDFSASIAELAKQIASRRFLRRLLTK